LLEITLRPGEFGLSQQPALLGAIAAPLSVAPWPRKPRNISSVTGA